MIQHRLPLALALSGAFASLVACGSTEEAATPPPEPTTTTPEAAAPSVLEALPTPEVNMTKVLLGRRLFHDGRMSGDGSVACATCHSMDHGGAEDRRTSVGVGSAVGPINSPTVLNSSLNFVQFWDGRAATLEDQARGPVGNPLEMASDFPRVIGNLSADPTYVTEFAGLYPDGITEANIVDAIAEYERSLITPGRFDRFLGGETEALTADERAGHELFTTVGCTSCHRGPNLGGTMYQRMGLVSDYFAARGTPLTDADMGRFNVTHDEADRHRFKVPTLRNIALTGPYLHDGSQATLPEVVRIMGRHQLGRELDDEQVRLIVAFLGALTGELPAHARMPADGTTVAPTGEVTPTTGEEVHPEGGPPTGEAAPAAAPGTPPALPMPAPGGLSGLSPLPSPPHPPGHGGLPPAAGS
jgi:cytochrome c peroxidase